jgi:hypothetical protein
MVEWDVVLYLVAFAIILILLVRLATKARRQTAATTTQQENPAEGMLLRFLDDESGTRIGETVALEGDEFIVKGPNGFLAVPTASVREEGKGLRLTQSFDPTSARQKGEAWRERSHKVITYADSELPKDDPQG